MDSFQALDSTNLDAANLSLLHLETASQVCPLFIGLAERPSGASGRHPARRTPLHAPTCQFALAGTRAATVGAAVLLASLPLGLPGCASAPSSGDEGMTRSSVRSGSVDEQAPPPPARPRRERVVFTDEPTPDPRSSEGEQSEYEVVVRGAKPVAARGGDDASLVDALAASYRDDREALSEMERRRTDRARDARPDESEELDAWIPTTSTTPSTPPSATPSTTMPPARTSDPDPEPESTNARPPAPSKRRPAAEPESGKPEAPAPNQPSAGSADVEDLPVDRTGAPGEASVTPISQRRQPVPASQPVVETAPTPEPTPASRSAAQASAAPPSEQDASAADPSGSTPILGVNAPLELPSATPTDPPALARLLAEALARRSAVADDPMRDWIAYAALAIAEPSIELPENFGEDLLPAERDRIMKLRTAFAAIGRTIAEKSGASAELDRALVDELALALSGGPKLGIPKLEICERIESFGRYVARSDNRFRARSKDGFIAYVELDGFTSALEDGQYLTRLATRVSIESARDEIEVWTRSPDWMPVVDASPVRRGEFFFGEIVHLSEHLTVGAYRLKFEVRDEATGKTATATYPLQVVADSFVSAPGE